MIDFVLTEARQTLRKSVQQFAETYLASARKEYEKIPIGGAVMTPQAPKNPFV